ncbi:MAG: hypothetical protein DLM66_13645 [Candidatus Dormiibacter spiritus]|nr:MAG: hypothetical protein DLM66_13645 [Candidatus Dormibacteraeota bacterium]
MSLLLTVSDRTFGAAALITTHNACPPCRVRHQLSEHARRGRVPGLAILFRAVAAWLVKQPGTPLFRVSLSDEAAELTLPVRALAWEERHP